jgi:hypothetical protein
MKLRVEDGAPTLDFKYDGVSLLGEKAEGVRGLRGDGGGCEG